MRNVNWKKLIYWILITEGVGVVTGLLSMNGVEYYNMAVTQPPFSPPKWLFPLVWGILYALMGISAYLISESATSAKRSQGLNLMVAQLIVNFFWPLFFFNVRAYGFSLAWLILLWVLVAWMIFTFKKVSPMAAYLQIPYLLWLSFAIYLNAGVLYLNS